MLKTITTLALVMTTLMALAQTQQPFSIRGKITDKENVPVEAATVLLINANDSTSLRATTTDKAGGFELKATTEGRYVLKISFIGFKTLVKRIEISDKRHSYDLGTMTMKHDSNVIGEATVTAEAPPIVVKGDTISYSAAAIRLHEGAMLEDLIKKIPGAEIDANGNITINGKAISNIMIDGKEFFVNDPDIALKNLPADAIKEVKTYDRKSEMTRTTGIEDGEENNVLDVRIKEGMKKGWFGNLLAGGGSKNKYETNAMVNRFKGDMHFSVIGSANNTNGMGSNDIDNADISAEGKNGVGETKSQSIGANFSLNKEKIEIHADLSYNRRDQFTERKESKETFLVRGSTFDRKINENNSIANNLRGAFRLKWNIDSLTTLQINQNVNYGKSNNDRYIDSHTLDYMLDTINAGLSSTDAESRNYSLNGNIMLNRRLGKAGRNLTLRARYGISDSNGDELSISDIFFYDNDSLSNITRLTDNGSRTTSYNVSLNYSEPLWEKAYLSVGYEFSKSSSSSLRLPVYDNSPASIAEAFENETYNFKTEHTVKVALQSSRKKLFYNIGLDFVPLESRTKVDRGANKGLDKEQSTLNFQPRANIVIRMDETRQLHLSYRGRSATPSILDLQEIKDISDPMNLVFGNPNLKNSFSNMMSISYSNYNPYKGSSIMFIASANNTVNGITQRTTFDPKTGVRTTRSENINGNWNANMNFVYSTPLKNKKFNVGTYISCSYSHRVGYSSMTDDAAEQAVSKTNNAMLGNRLFATYRCDAFDVRLQTVFDTNLTRNNLNAQNDRNIFNYGLNADLNINLPWDMYFSTSASYIGRRGYSSGYDDDYVLWNAQLSKNFLKEKQATVRIKVYDILQNQSNTFRTMGYDYTLDTETNVIGSYVMVQFIYRFNTMGGGKRDASAQPGKHKGERRGREMMRGMAPMPMPI